MNFEWPDIHLKNQFGTFFKIQNYYLHLNLHFIYAIYCKLFIFFQPH